MKGKKGKDRLRRKDNEKGKKSFSPRVIEVLDIEARAGVCNTPPTFGKDATCGSLYS